MNDELQENRNYNCIYQTIHKNVKKVIGCDEFLLYLIEFITTRIEDELYMLPDTLYSYIRTLP